MQTRKTHISKFNLITLTMFDTSKLSSKGQVVIPEAMRIYLNLKEGARFVIRTSGSQLILEKESDFLKRLESLEMKKDKQGWLALAQKSLGRLWDNEEDENEWKKYL
jgi:AbrB family looped-hinge helix DNA binding protein